MLSAALPRVARLVLLCVLLAGSPLAEPATAQDEGRTRFLRWAYQDASAFALDTSIRSPLVVVAGAAVLVPTARLDLPLLEEVQEGYRGSLAAYLDATNELGGPRGTSLAAGVFAVSLLTDNARFQDAAFTSLQSLIYAGMLTRTLKGVFGRFRPDAGGGAYRFDPFSQHMSFPSGHTTAAFALVTPWVLYYPHAASLSLFGLSLGTAVARIARDKHWPTDVLAGAAIGFTTAHYLSRRHQRSAEAPRLEVRPHLALDGGGLGLRLRLD